ncbi:hypothetical protein LNK15_02450 [Jeotgalicoccus huakuii]|nr:hypothetical protein [Jeotgalicoccus huakuii]
MIRATRRASFIIIAMLLMITPLVKAQEEINPYLLNMVDIRASSEEANQEAWQMISRMNHVENRILYETNNHGAIFILADTPITEQPEFEYLKGSVPRGHTNSWDSIPGAGAYESIARIGYSDPGKGHSAINLELHEYGHVVDSFTVGVQVSETEEFRAVQNAELDSLFGDNSQKDYYNNVDEYFAEAFAMYYLNDESRSELASKAPRTLAFFDKFAHSILSVGEVTGNTVTMHWDPHEDAVEYEVFRNDESVGTTTGPNYRIEGLDTDTTYDFKVIAKDSEGKALYTSYTRSALTGSVQDPPDVDIEELEATISEVESAYEDEEMGRSLTRALQNANTYIADVNNDEYTSGGNEITQGGVDSLNASLQEAWEEDEEIKRQIEEEKQREEEERQAEEKRKAEEQAALEAKEREEAEALAEREALMSTLTKVGVGLLVIVAVFIGWMVYRKRK